PAVNAIESPAAVRMTSPAGETVTGGTVPAVVSVRPPWDGRGTGRLVLPAHTTLVPLGPSDALTVNRVCALTAAGGRPPPAGTAAGGNAMVRLTAGGWVGLPGFVPAGRTARPAA